MITTHRTVDLGHQWSANIWTYADGTEALTLRNSERGQRIDLTDAEVKRLREAIRAGEGR